MENKLIKEMIENYNENQVRFNEMMVIYTALVEEYTKLFNKQIILKKEILGLNSFNNDLVNKIREFEPNYLKIMCEEVHTEKGVYTLDKKTGMYNFEKKY